MNKIAEILYKHRKNNQIAIVQDDRSITYEQLHKTCIGISRILKEEDTASIAIYIENSIAFAEAYFSIIYSGKTALPINSLFTASEVDKITSKYNVNTLITVSSLKDKVVNREGLHIIYIDELDEKWESIDSESIYYDQESPFVMYNPTSGTTGENKLVTYSHESVMNGIEAYSVYLGQTAKTVDLICISMCSMIVLVPQLLADIYAGAKIVILTGILSINKIFKTIEKQRVTNFTTVPTFLRIMMEMYDESKHDISSLQSIHMGGEKVGVELYNQIRDKLGNVEVIQGYGLTECMLVVCRTSDDWNYKPEAVGRPMGVTKVKIVDKDGCELSSNVAGEICITSKVLMSGYYGKEDMFKNDLWFHTGDYGMMDEEGYLYIHGRIKNIIINAGRNIYPEEVEQVIGSYEYIKEVRVRGEENAEVGEIVVADIIPNNPNFTIEGLTAFVRDKLALYKIPTKFYVVEEIEKTISKKIKRY